MNGCDHKQITIIVCLLLLLLSGVKRVYLDKLQHLNFIIGSWTHKIINYTGSPVIHRCSIFPTSNRIERWSGRDHGWHPLLGTFCGADDRHGPECSPPAISHGGWLQGCRRRNHHRELLGTSRRRGTRVQC